MSRRGPRSLSKPHLAALATGRTEAAAVNRYLADYNASAKPFIWIAGPDIMIAAQAAGTKRLVSLHQARR